MDFSLLTDGLRAEREQGITIDVAYRYFATPRRKFIIADTPGHEQYTRNMATGASTADLAVILVDARHGVLPQSRRHAFIASLLGIPHIVVAVNKMDLVDYRREVFDADPRGVRRLSRHGWAPPSRITSRSARCAATTWCTRARACRGTTAQACCATWKRCPWPTAPPPGPLRFPVQYVIRPTRISAAMPGRWRRAWCGRATRWWRCPPGAPAA